MSDNPFALVIEDDPDAAEIFSAAIRAAEFEVETITTGDKAIERLKVTTPALIVLDMHLPHVAGPEILEHVRADPRLAETKVMITTADAGMADIGHDQADLVLLKPISFSQIRDLAKRLRNPPSSIA